ncbi:MAG: FHA domain-containing protein [Proteobacteria bacterium]|nr:FHA domain-containing protein [Pseudomonadota bacterium]MCP4915714.1 FHA domain-containing protein [Pseudomonadota bacterium]
MQTLLVLLQEDQPVHMVTVGYTPVQIGRAATNDLALVDPSLSRRHASVWLRGGRTWLADHSSTNGTFVNDKQVRGAIEITPTDTIRLGNATHLRVEHRAGEEEEAQEATFVLLDLRTHVRRALQTGHNELSDGWILDVDADGETVELLGPRGPGLVRIDQDFEAGSGRYRVEAPMPVGETSPLPGDETSNSFAYIVDATLNGASGAEATVKRVVGGAPHIVCATPAVLMFILSRKLEQDLKGSMSPSVAGWCSDNDIRVGIWGRDVDHSSNTLNVLLYRTRKELEKAGFHGGCIEKRRRATRLAVVEASTK